MHDNVNRNDDNVDKRWAPIQVRSRWRSWGLVREGERFWREARCGDDDGGDGGEDDDSGGDDDDVFNGYCGYYDYLQVLQPREGINDEGIDDL